MSCPRGWLWEGPPLTRAVQTLGGHRRTFRCTAWQDHGLRPTVGYFSVQTLGGHRHTFRCTAWQDHGFRPTVSTV